MRVENLHLLGFPVDALRVKHFPAIACNNSPKCLNILGTLSTTRTMRGPNSLGGVYFFSFLSFFFLLPLWPGNLSDFSGEAVLGNQYTGWFSLHCHHAYAPLPHAACPVPSQWISIKGQAAGGGLLEMNNYVFCLGPWPKCYWLCAKLSQA